MHPDGMISLLAYRGHPGWRGRISCDPRLEPEPST
ncbi:MAG: hypothetical protein GVY22_11720 [Gammaproteobacteria bacterium]|nr:hypothetical protein [Gammaproteobacteria bacterium]